MATEGVEGGGEVGEGGIEFLEVSLYLGCLFLDLQAVQSHHDCHQIRIEEGRRDGDDFMGEGVVQRAIFLFRGGGDLVVDVLGGDIHEGEVERAFGWADIGGGDLINVFCDVGVKAAAGLCAGVVGFGSEDGFEAWQGELGVDGDGVLGHEDEGIDDLAIFEGVLEAEASGWEDSRKQVAEGPFAKLAAEFGTGHDVLEAAEVGAEVDDFSGIAGELDELLIEAVEGFLLGAEVLGDVLMAFLEGLGGGVAEGIAGRLERVELLLETGEICGVGGGVAADGLDGPGKYKENHHDRNKQNGYDCEEYAFHDLAFQDESIIMRARPGVKGHEARQIDAWCMRKEIR